MISDPKVIASLLGQDRGVNAVPKLRAYQELDVVRLLCLYNAFVCRSSGEGASDADVNIAAMELATQAHDLHIRSCRQKVEYDSQSCGCIVQRGLYQVAVGSRQSCNCSFPGYSHCIVILLRICAHDQSCMTLYPLIRIWQGDMVADFIDECLGWVHISWSSHWEPGIWLG